MAAGGASTNAIPTAFDTEQVLATHTYRYSCISTFTRRIQGPSSYTNTQRDS